MSFRESSGRPFARRSAGGSNLVGGPNQLSGMRFLGHKDKFPGILRTIRASIIIGIDGPYFKPTSLKQMLSLIPKQIAQRKGMHKAFLVALGVRYVVHKFRLNDLIVQIPLGNFVPTNYAPTIGQGEFWLFTELLAKIVPGQ